MNEPVPAVEAPLRTSDEVAEMLRVDVVTVRRLVSRGELAAYRVGNEYRFGRADIEEYLRRQYMPARDPVETQEDIEWEATIEQFGRFTNRARQALIAAREEAMRFNHTYIGTEHLLLGLTDEADSLAVRMLTRLGADLQRVRGAVEYIVGHGDRPGRPVSGQIGLTPRAKKALSLALDEALALGHPGVHIGTEHLLLGLLREGDGIAAGVLQSLAVNLEMARTEVRAFTGHGEGSGGAPPPGLPQAVPPLPEEAATLVTEGEASHTCTRCGARAPGYFRHCFHCGELLAQP